MDLALSLLASGTTLSPAPVDEESTLSPGPVDSATRFPVETLAPGELTAPTSASAHVSIFSPPGETVQPGVTLAPLVLSHQLARSSSPSLTFAPFCEGEIQAPLSSPNSNGFCSFPVCSRRDSISVDYRDARSVVQRDARSFPNHRPGRPYDCFSDSGRLQ